MQSCGWCSELAGSRGSQLKRSYSLISQGSSGRRSLIPAWWLHDSRYLIEYDWHGESKIKSDAFVLFLYWTRFHDLQNLTCTRTSLLLKATCNSESDVQFVMLLISYIEARDDLSQKSQIELLSDKSGESLTSSLAGVCVVLVLPLADCGLPAHASSLKANSQSNTFSSFLLKHGAR